MAGRSVGYDPSTLLRAKRERLAQEAAQSEFKAGDPAKVSQDSGASDDGSPMRVFDDADHFVEIIKPKVAQLIGIVGEMKKMADACTNSSLSDDDRKQVHSRFVEKRREIAKIVNETDFKGQKLFSGDLMRSSLKLAVGRGDLDVIEIRFESLRNESTGLEGHKIDTLVNARNSLRDFEGVIGRFQLVAMMMKAKEDAINLKRRQFIEENNIPEEVANARKAKAMQAVIEKRREIQRLTMHMDLKEEQERRAEYEGRETALLINRKI